MKNPFPALTTPRLVLRELQAKDAPRLVELLRDKEISRWFAWDLSNATAREERSFIRGARKAYKAGRGLAWAICERENGAVIGFIGLDSIDSANKSAVATFWLGKAYRGKGCMTEAFHAVLRHGFNALHLNRVSAGHLEGNVPSSRVQQKCGLRCEGTHRQKVYKNGRFIDLVEYAILREEYK